jgi:PRTRC genetic system protein B
MSDLVIIPPHDNTATVKPIKPVFALVVYEGAESFACKHPVYERAGKPILGAAQGLTENEGRTLMESLGGRGLIPTRVNTLATSATSVAWWVPPSQRALLFDAKYAQTASIARLSGVPVPLPGFVMIASPPGLRVYAVRGNERPELRTPLMTAPVWNLFPSDVICRGSVQYPQGCTPEDQDAWEAAFFQSVFTGPSRSDRYMNWSRSYEELLCEALRVGAFPEAVLMPAALTLGEALTR